MAAARSGERKLSEKPHRNEKRALNTDYTQQITSNKINVDCTFMAHARHISTMRLENYSALAEADNHGERKPEVNANKNNKETTRKTSKSHVFHESSAIRRRGRPGRRLVEKVFAR